MTSSRNCNVQINQIFYDKLKAHNFDSQVVETRIKVTIQID